MQILLPLVAALVPLVLTPHLLFYYDVTPKVFALLMGAAVAAVLLGLNLGGLRTLWASRMGRWFCILLACQEALFLAAAAASSDWMLAVNGTAWRRLGVVT